jgi:malate dehydrogenase (oxaloacetate-decarboxylating)
MAATPSAQYSLTLRVEIDHLPGMLGQVASAIGRAGGTIGAVDLVHVDGGHTVPGHHGGDQRRPTSGHA